MCQSWDQKPAFSPPPHVAVWGSHFSVECICRRAHECRSRVGTVNKRQVISNSQRWSSSLWFIIQPVSFPFLLEKTNYIYTRMKAFCFMQVALYKYHICWLKWRLSALFTIWKLQCVLRMEGRGHASFPFKAAHSPGHHVFILAFCLSLLQPAS